jgi:hypothetical protein
LRLWRFLIFSGFEIRFPRAFPEEVASFFLASDKVRRARPAATELRNRHPVLNRLNLK